MKAVLTVTTALIYLANQMTIPNLCNVGEFTTSWFGRISINSLFHDLCNKKYSRE